LVDEVSVVRELANQWVDLRERERRGPATLEVATQRAIVGDAELEDRGARVVDRRRAVLSYERAHALQFANHIFIAVLARELVREHADVASGARELGEQIERRLRRLLRSIFLAHATTAASLHEVFA